MAQANEAQFVADEKVKLATTEEQKKDAEKEAAQARRDTAAAARADKAAKDKVEKDLKAAVASQGAALTAFQNQIGSPNLKNSIFATNKYMMRPGKDQTETKRTGLTPSQCLTECASDPLCANVQFMEDNTVCYQIKNDFDKGFKWNKDNKSAQNMSIVIDAHENKKFKKGFRRMSPHSTSDPPNTNRERCGKFLMNTIPGPQAKSASIITKHGPMDKNLKTLVPSMGGIRRGLPVNISGTPYAPMPTRMGAIYHVKLQSMVGRISNHPRKTLKLREDICLVLLPTVSHLRGICRI